VTRTWDLTGDLPLPGWHYPKSFVEFVTWFPDDARARAYLEAVRFRRGLACPRCGMLGPKRGSDGLWWCSSCRRRFSATVGTLMDHAHLSASVWLAAAWQVTNTKAGVSALSLSRSLGVSYASAWHLLHKLRSAMSFVHHDRLRGVVEFDETFVGGHDEGVGSGGTQGHASNKITVFVATERTASGTIGRIRLARGYDASALSIARFIAQTIEPGSTLVTDGWTAYPWALQLLEREGLRYEHLPTTLKWAPGHAHDLLPGVHRVASLLKRWLLGTHQGAVSDHQMDQYLAEFVFRFNRRSSTHRGLLFWRLVCALTEAEPLRRTDVNARRGETAANDRALVEELVQLAIDHKRERELVTSRAYRARKAGRRQTG
jgi:transposase-like protein